MKNEIANEIADYLENNGTKVNDVYFNNICRDVDKYFNLSGLPMLAYSKYINPNKMDTKLLNLMNNFRLIVNENISVMVERDTTNDNLFIASALIGRYIEDSIISGDRVHKILYVDTPLLLADYKKMIDASAINPPVLFHTMETLNKDIYWYDYVIWDRFNCINSNYDLSKLQEIIHHRYLNMCGNLYMGLGESDKDCMANVSAVLASSMNITMFAKLNKSKYEYISTAQIDGNKGGMR